MNLASEQLRSGVKKLLDSAPGRRLLEYRARFLAAGRPLQVAMAGAVALALLVLLMLGGGGTPGVGSISFETRRGNLDITVLEGGALEALVSTEIRSEVKGRDGVKILSIVEEGYRVTEDDVAAGKILVELDTAQLIDEQLNQEIAVETAEASYIERKAQYEIQLNQNITEINDARQEMRFARLDFEKYLGARVVREITGSLQIEERLARAEAAELAALEAESNPAPGPIVEVVPEVTEDVAGFEPPDIASMPPQMQERMRQLLAENGGQLPPEVLERMQRFSQGGFPGPGGDARPFDGSSPAGRRGGVGGGQPIDGANSSGPDASFEARNRQEPAPRLTLAAVEPVPPASTAALLMDDDYMSIRDKIDFSSYADMERLEDGEAKQELRKLQDELQVARQEYLLAQDRIEGQRRLESRGFITPTELEAEELNLSKAFNKQLEKETALKLYIQYTFPKDAEEKLSDYENAVMGYQRQLKENVAEQAQEEARLSSAERKFRLEQVKLADVNQQLAAAIIRATRPGLVVYGAADQNAQRFRGGGNQEAIQEGATVRERQPILTIPDMREMAVKVNIHESAVQRVAVGQRVNVLVDAFPDQRLSGVVTKVAVVADSANAFMNPDLKVYPTTVKIDGTHDWLRPGMSAQVEIFVDRLEDVVYVPLQAVSYSGDQRVVYVDNAGRPERRTVRTGAFSEQFIQVVEGLREGEKVLLLAPQQDTSGASVNPQA